MCVCVCVCVWQEIEKLSIKKPGGIKDQISLNDQDYYTTIMQPTLMNMPVMHSTFQTVKNY